MRFYEALTAARRFGGASLLSLAAVLISLLPPTAVTALQYDRAQIRAGEVYRLLTCHWTHWNTNHLAWDAAAFFLLAVACECRSRSRFLATLAIAAMVVPAGLFVLQPEMIRYRGLSALASALFTLLAVDVAREKAHFGQWAWVVAIAAIGLGFVIKVGIETHYRTTAFVENSSDFVPVPVAHLLGACCGLVTSVLVAKPTKSPRYSLREMHPRGVEPLTLGSEGQKLLLTRVCEM
jgi:rhomboid family GlyGly-CTERM serine protease